MYGRLFYNRAALPQKNAIMLCSGGVSPLRVILRERNALPYTGTM
jgi:hypothetical protein